MIIKIVLGFALLVMAGYSVSQYRRSMLASVLIMVASINGLLLVFIPELATQAANAVGVGRGVDLIFYILSLAAMIAIFNLHLRLREHAELTTKLARYIAVELADLQDKTKFR